MSVVSLVQVGLIVAIVVLLAVGLMAVNRGPLWPGMEAREEELRARRVEALRMKQEDLDRDLEAFRAIHGRPPYDAEVTEIFARHGLAVRPRV